MYIFKHSLLRVSTYIRVINKTLPAIAGVKVADWATRQKQSIVAKSRVDVAETDRMSQRSLLFAQE